MVAALKDVAGATIVGSRSYGKGIGQIKIVRRDRNALQITYLQLQGISKRIGDYHHKGIDPDIFVNGTNEQVLLKAVQVNEPSATSIRKLRKQVNAPSPVAGYRVVYEE
jgi:C-terminal processing protease CtpA/Prc